MSQKSVSSLVPIDEIANDDSFLSYDMNESLIQKQLRIDLFNTLSVSSSAPGEDSS